MKVGELKGIKRLSFSLNLNIKRTTLQPSALFVVSGSRVVGSVTHVIYVTRNMKITK